MTAYWSRRRVAASIAAALGIVGDAHFSKRAAALTIDESESPAEVIANQARLATSSDAALGVSDTAANRKILTLNLAGTVRRHRALDDGSPTPVLRSDIERETDDAISVLEFIPRTSHPAVRAGTYGGDLSAYLNAGLATGADIKIPSGCTIPIDRPLYFARPGQTLFGGGDRTTCTIRLLPSFDSSALAALTFSDACAIHDITWSCDQPAGDVTQAAGGLNIRQIIKYPWLMDVSGAGRCRIERVRMSRAWNGINAQGDAAQGLTCRSIEDGCLNAGLVLGTAAGHGPADFVPIDDWMCWVFGSVGSGLQLWSEANPGYVSVIQCDGLSIGLITLYQRRLLLAALPRSQVNVALATSIGQIKLDSDSAQIVASSGSYVIGTLDGLASGAEMLEVNGAQVTIGAARIGRPSRSPAPMARVTAGSLRIGCGEVFNPYSTHDFAVDGGLLQLTNITFSAGASSSKPQGFINQTGGRVMISNCAVEDAPIKSEAATGYFLRLATNDYHTVIGNYAGGRRMRLPASPVSTCLGPNNNVHGIDRF